MKEIKLTRGKVALVDDEDYVWISKWKWHAIKGKRKKTFYAYRNIKKNDKKGSALMHRVILGLTDPKVMIDHIDRNGLNNQRSNLRIADSFQNITNRESLTNSTSKYVG